MNILSRMVYLLDTCTVSDFIKGDENTLFKLKSKSPTQIKISSITAYELRYGLKKNPRLKMATKNAIHGFIKDTETIPFGIEESDIAADIRTTLEREGKPIGAYDILIAATALTNEFILATSNEKEFIRIPNLAVENWRY